VKDLFQKLRGGTGGFTAENTEGAEVREDERLNAITGNIIAAAIKVHRAFGAWTIGVCLRGVHGV